MAASESAQALSNGSTWIRIFNASDSGGPAEQYTVSNHSTSANDITCVVVPCNRYADASASGDISAEGLTIEPGYTISFSGMDRNRIRQVWVKSASATVSGSVTRLA